MIYKSVSIKNVIGRIIRNTRLQDSSFIQDMGEWIPEAMGYMRTRVVLSPQWKDITVDYYKGKLPCDLRTLSAVAYKNTRMRYNGGIAVYGIKKEHVGGVSYTSQPTSKVLQETISNKTFTADTTAGALWAIDALIMGTSEVFINGPIMDTGTAAASAAALSVVLNALNYGTFTVAWDGSTLTIQLIDDGTVTDISYHRVTLDSPVLLMGITGNVSIPTAYETNDLNTIKSLEQCNCLAVGVHTYYTELDYLNTSLCDGTVRIFYKAIPVDEEGFPLIPDNEDYKEALYWYVRSKMIGAGYEDTVFKIGDCEQRYMLHAIRAIGQIRYPSVDQMETKLEISTRLVLPENYFETFFSNPGKEGTLDM